MVVIQQAASSQANSANTSDWIGKLKGGVIYAYDLSVIVSQGVGSIGFIKRDLEQTPEHVSQKSNLPIGEHIREAIQIIKGRVD